MKAPDDLRGFFNVAGAATAVATLGVRFDGFHFCFGSKT
jgi:hypothetical protein